MILTPLLLLAFLPGFSQTADFGASFWPNRCVPLTVEIGHLGDTDQGTILGQTDPVNCIIKLDRQAIRQTAPGPGPWWYKVWLCSVWLHEEGHASRYYSAQGYNGDHYHSPNPKSVMYPFAHIVRACMKLWPAPRLRTSSKMALVVFDKTRILW